MLMHDILNMILTSRASPCAYRPATGKFSILDVLKFDGTVIKMGLSAHQSSMKLVGLEKGPIGVEEARTLLDMSDEERFGYLLENPLVSEAVEVMSLSLSLSLSVSLSV